MVKRYGCAGILLFAMGLFPLLAQDNAMDRTIKHPTILLIMKMKKQQSMYTFG